MPYLDTRYFTNSSLTPTNTIYYNNYNITEIFSLIYNTII
jgi:hypothetical protein